MTTSFSATTHFRFLLRFFYSVDRTLCLFRHFTAFLHIRAIIDIDDLSVGVCFYLFFNSTGDFLVLDTITKLVRRRQASH